MNTTLGQKLRKWRGSKRQKEAAAELNVSIRTYQNWEQDVFVPKEMALAELLRRMERLVK